MRLGPMISGDVSIFSPVRAGSTLGFPVIIFACEADSQKRGKKGAAAEACVLVNHMAKIAKGFVAGSRPRGRGD